MIRFLHISDTHLGPTKEFVIGERSSYQDTQRLLSFINSLKFEVDFIVHTGDLISFQNKDAYDLAESVFQACSHKKYFVTGNHDEPKVLIKSSLFGPKNQLLNLEDSVSYTFEAGGYLGIVLDVKHPDDTVPSGVLPENLLEAVEGKLKNTHERFFVCLHFPLLSMDAPWIDGHLLVDRGEALHQLLVRYRDRCNGVFLGHIHQRTALSQDGITYYSSPSSSFQFGGWPSDIETLSKPKDGVPGCNLVTMEGSKTIVKYLTFPRD